MPMAVGNGYDEGPPVGVFQRSYPARVVVASSSSTGRAQIPATCGGASPSGIASVPELAHPTYLGVRPKALLDKEKTKNVKINLKSKSKSKWAKQFEALF